MRNFLFALGGIFVTSVVFLNQLGPRPGHDVNPGKSCAGDSKCVAAQDGNDQKSPPTHPNIIIILCDNLGYGDIGCFGNTKHRTPHIDRMAKEGRRFTSFYVTSGVCTPSRASLLTGCYPRRVNMHVDERGGLVLRPVSSRGLHPNEITIAELLRQAGYATALIGKWHLGDQPAFLPTRQGFNHYFGIPYSDDMTQRPGQPWPPLPLLRDERVIEAPVDRNLLTKRYTEESIRFIDSNKKKPFFLLLAHAMPGSTKKPFSSAAFRGKSANGPYGDSVEEIDWSTGQILQALKERNIDNKTLVIWTSDNGAPKRIPAQGSNAPLTGWGYTVSEGGMRAPCIMRWPKVVPAGSSSNELCTTMDLLPTFTGLAGAKIPQDRIIDGKDIRSLLSGDKNARSPHKAFYYYYGPQLQAVRGSKWKLYVPRSVALVRGKLTKVKIAARLYDLESDLRETRNLAEKHPKVVRRLLKVAAMARQDLGDLNLRGQNQRPAGRTANPKPLVKK